MYDEKNSEIWMELVHLLKSSIKSGTLAANTLGNVVNDTSCLPKIFHELCTDILLSSEWSHRVNAGNAIRILSSKFAGHLRHLLCTAECDGDLLLLADLNVSSVLSCGKSVELRGGRNESFYDSSLGKSSSNGVLYDKEWIRVQRSALQKRLGLEVKSIDSDAAAAIRFDDSEDTFSRLVDENDFELQTVRGERRKRRKKEAPSNSTSSTKGIFDSKSTISPHRSSETYIARLVRFLVVGLLDFRWETRHGSSIGLTSLINGLYPLDSRTQVSSSDSHVASEEALFATAPEVPLPKFIVEDILCSGICVLLLDRFIDFSTRISATSPVKEAAGQLIASALRYCNKCDSELVVGIALDMCTSSVDPAVIYGGLVAIKYILTLHPAQLLSSKGAVLIDILLSSLYHGGDDVNCIAAQVIKALSYGYKRLLFTNTEWKLEFCDYPIDAPTLECTISVFDIVIKLCNGLKSSTLKLTSLSGRLIDICDALWSCSCILQMKISMQQCNIRDVHSTLDCCVALMDVYSELFSQLHLFSEETRRKSFSILISGCEHIEHIFTSLKKFIQVCIIKNACDVLVVYPSHYNSTEENLAKSATRLICCFICAACSKPATSLGDLFLVSKEVHELSDAQFDERFGSSLASAGPLFQSNTNFMLGHDVENGGKIFANIFFLVVCLADILFGGHDSTALTETMEDSCIQSKSILQSLITDFIAWSPCKKGPDPHLRTVNATNPLQMSSNNGTKAKEMKGKVSSENENETKAVSDSIHSSPYSLWDRIHLCVHSSAHAVALENFRKSINANDEDVDSMIMSSSTVHMTCLNSFGIFSFSDEAGRARISQILVDIFLTCFSFPTHFECQESECLRNQGDPDQERSLRCCSQGMIDLIQVIKNRSIHILDTTLRCVQSILDSRERDDESVIFENAEREVRPTRRNQQLLQERHQSETKLYLDPHILNPLQKLHTQKECKEIMKAAGDCVEELLFIATRVCSKLLSRVIFICTMHFIEKMCKTSPITIPDDHASTVSLEDAEIGPGVLEELNQAIEIIFSRLSEFSLSSKKSIASKSSRFIITILRNLVKLLMSARCITIALASASFAGNHSEIPESVEFRDTLNNLLQNTFSASNQSQLELVAIVIVDIVGTITSSLLSMSNAVKGKNIVAFFNSVLQQVQQFLLKSLLDFPSQRSGTLMIIKLLACKLNKNMYVHMCTLENFFNSSPIHENHAHEISTLLWLEASMQMLDNATLEWLMSNNFIARLIQWVTNVNDHDNEMLHASSTYDQSEYNDTDGGNSDSLKDEHSINNHNIDKSSTLVAKILIILVGTRMSVVSSRKTVTEMIAHVFSSYLDPNVTFKGRLYVSCIFRTFILSLPEDAILLSYKSFLEIAISHIGDYEQIVRKNCTACLRKLVPLAPIAKGDMHMKKIYSSKCGMNDEGSTCTGRDDTRLGNLGVDTNGDDEGTSTNSLQTMRLVNHILGGETPISLTSSVRDAPIIDFMRQHTNLLRPTNETRSELLQSSNTSNFPTSLDHGTINASNSLQTFSSDVAKMVSSSPLRDYQWVGVSWLTELRRSGLGAILADEMGLGKSLQALTTIAVLRVERWLSNMQSEDLPSLVVCPSSLQLHWEDEIKKFFPDWLLKPMRYTRQGSSDIKCSNEHQQGDDTSSDNKVNPILRMMQEHFGPSLQSNSIVIISYDSLRRDNFVFTAGLWDFVILDEAHLIKNPSTLTARAVFGLQARMRIALTGTPIQNHVEEIWSLMQFALPDFLGDEATFRDHYVKPIQKSFKERKKLIDIHKMDTSSSTVLGTFNASIDISAQGIDCLHKLHKQVLPFILRRTKSNVAQELPPKTIVDILCPLSHLQKKLYLDFQAGLRINDASLEMELKKLLQQKQGVATQGQDTFRSTNEGGSSSKQSDDRKLHPLQALTYLKLVCVHPSLVISQTHAAYRNHILDKTSNSGKLCHLARLLMDCGVVSQEECVRIDDLASPDDECNEKSVTRADKKSETSPDDESEDEYIDPIFEQTHRKSITISEENNDQLDTGVRNRSVRAAVKQATKKYSLQITDTSFTTTSSSSTSPPKRHSNRRPTSSQSTKMSSSPEINSERLAAPNDVTVSSTHSSVASKIATHRCLIFAQHKSALDMIEQCVLQRHFPSVPYARLDGDVSPITRSLIAKRFNSQLGEPTTSSISSSSSSYFSNESPLRLLIMTTRSCGLGLNLTAADTVIFVEHDWNPFIDLQAMDRVHRLGQMNPVTIYRLLAETTIEARIMGLQGLKQKLSDEIINENNASTFADKKSALGETGKAQQNGNGRNGSFGSALWDSMLVASSFENLSSSSVPQITSAIEEYESLDLEAFLSSIGT